MNLATAKAILTASRPVSWVNTAFPFAAGYLLVRHHFGWTAALLTLYFLIPYNLLLYGVNDVYDYETDILNDRKGGIEGARLQRTQLRTLLWTLSVINIPLILGVLTIGTTAARITFIIVIALALAYSVPKLRFKERPLIDSLTSSSHFCGPLVYALVLTGWHSSYLPYVLAFFAWGMASHAFGAVQDIIPDRQAGIGSIATVIGGARTVWLAMALYGLSGCLLLGHSPYAYAPAACSLLYIADIAPYYRITDAQSARSNKGWKRFIWINQITGFVVTVMLILILRHHSM